MDPRQRQNYESYIQGRVTSLRRTAYRLAGSWDAADDLVQDTFVKLYLHWAKATAARSIDAYSRRILVNTFLEQLRRPWYRRVLSVATPPDRPTGAVDHDGALDLRAALDRLAAGQRAVLILRYWEGLDVAETAEALGCSVGTVKSQTSAAIGRLRRLLPEYAGVAEPAGTDRSTR
ncbi:SigE family RNA polymerase sigma factor [Actinocatenispora thailandica]|nr:SigE family RNA polymerase sigma factor [Actinocatenispora thailandica]